MWDTRQAVDAAGEPITKPMFYSRYRIWWDYQDDHYENDKCRPEVYGAFRKLCEEALWKSDAGDGELVGCMQALHNIFIAAGGTGEEGPLVHKPGVDKVEERRKWLALEIEKLNRKDEAAQHRWGVSGNLDAMLEGSFGRCMETEIQKSRLKEELLYGKRLSPYFKLQDALARWSKELHNVYDSFKEDRVLWKFMQSEFISPESTFDHGYDGHMKINLAEGDVCTQMDAEDHKKVKKFWQDHRDSSNLKEFIKKGKWTFDENPQYSSEFFQKLINDRCGLQKYLGMQSIRGAISQQVGTSAWERFLAMRYMLTENQELNAHPDRIHFDVDAKGNANPDLKQRDYRGILHIFPSWLQSILSLQWLYNFFSYITLEIPSNGWFINTRQKLKDTRTPGVVGFGEH
jgi:hypothetical protein